jgi:HTH-type transcriptional regulator/antitoxin MqsA
MKMPGKWDGKRCSTCGVGTLHDDARERTNEYRGRTFRATYSGAFCDRCDDGMVYHDPQIDENWESFSRQVDEDERRELAAIRERLKLTQDDAAKITGGGHNAFSRYERGEAKPMMAVVNLFRLLDRYPSLLREIIDMRVAESPSPLYQVSGLITAGWGVVSMSGAVVRSSPVAVPRDPPSADEGWTLTTEVTAFARERAA